MEKQATIDPVRAPEILKFFAGDPFFERAQQINNLIARRAYELFASKGFTDGHDREDWLRAEAEILLSVPIEVTETQTELTVRAEVPGFTERDLEIRVAPRSLCITGQRQETSEQKPGQAVYSEWRSGQIFRVLELPCQIDPERVRATLSDGVLEITLSKVAEMGKRIPVLTKAAAA